MSLPPLPAESYVCNDPSSSEYGLWCERYGPYDAEQMREYARAAVAAEREACAAVCARLYGAPLAPDDGKHVEGWQDALDIAESRIRARGDA